MVLLVSTCVKQKDLSFGEKSQFATLVFSKGPSGNDYRYTAV